MNFLWLLSFWVLDFWFLLFFFSSISSLQDVSYLVLYGGLFCFLSFTVLYDFIYSLFVAQLSCFWCLAKAVMEIIIHQFSSSQVTQLCLTLCHPMDRSMPDLPVHYQLPEFTQTRVHWVSNAIQPSHPLSSSSPPALNLAWHQGLFKWVSSSHHVAKVLEFQLQHQSFQWTPRTDLL